MNNNKSPIQKFNVVLDYNLQLRQLWLENHEPDLNTEFTIQDLDVLHQRGWKR